MSHPGSVNLTTSKSAMDPLVSHLSLVATVGRKVLHMSAPVAGICTSSLWLMVNWRPLVSLHTITSHKVSPEIFTGLRQNKINSKQQNVCLSLRRKDEQLPKIGKMEKKFTKKNLVQANFAKKPHKALNYDIGYIFLKYVNSKCLNGIRI